MSRNIKAGINLQVLWVFETKPNISKRWRLGVGGIENLEAWFLSSGVLFILPLAFAFNHRWDKAVKIHLKPPQLHYLRRRGFIIQYLSSLIFFRHHRTQSRTFDEKILEIKDKRRVSRFKSFSSKPVNIIHRTKGEASSRRDEITTPLRFT